MWLVDRRVEEGGGMLGGGVMVEGYSCLSNYFACI